MAQALLALKDLRQAKTRLADLLDTAQREALARAMAEDVVAVLVAHRDIARITLVCDDPTVAQLAHDYGAQCWPEQSLGCRGLNALLQCASERLLRAADDVLLVLHADLPLLTVDDISAALDGQRDAGGLVVAGDRHATGTNLLAFDRRGLPQFCFGTDSYAAYIEQAHSAGVPLHLLHRPGIAADVDEPADLDYLLARLHAYPQRRTAALLHCTALGARVARALATLPGSANSIETANRG